ncbi:MAG: hypothetical protein M3485_10215 [Pseudomonadota bacterium]|nr:hypothetical protein [Pseudomonadota bacterium]
MSKAEPAPPPHVTAAINGRVIPEFKAWFMAEGLKVDDLDHFSVQPVDNLRDWVFKVHLVDGRIRLFPILFPVLH